MFMVIQWSRKPVGGNPLISTIRLIEIPRRGVGSGMFSDHNHTQNRVSSFGDSKVDSRTRDMGQGPNPVLQPPPLPLVHSLRTKHLLIKLDRGRVPLSEQLSKEEKESGLYQP